MRDVDQFKRYLWAIPRKRKSNQARHVRVRASTCRGQRTTRRALYCANCPATVYQKGGGGLNVRSANFPLIIRPVLD